MRIVCPSLVALLLCAVLAGCGGDDPVPENMDLIPSEPSGGDDCDDDDAGVGSCETAWGMECEEGHCACTGTECEAGEWTSGDVPGSPLTVLATLPEGGPAWDLDGDGMPDDSFTFVLRELFRAVGVDLDEQFAGAIENGELSVAAVPFAYEGRIDLPSVSTVDGSELTVDPADIHPTEAVTRSRLSGMREVEDGVYEGDGGFLRVPFPMGRRASIEVPIHVRRSRVELDEDGSMRGQIGGFLTADEFVGALNAYFASEQCTCLEGDLQIESLPGGFYSCPVGNTQACEGRCGTVYGLCGFYLHIVLGQVDVDTDGDGELDAGGIHLTFETSGTASVTP